MKLNLKGKGALADVDLRRLEGAVESVSTHAKPEIGPASIDVPCGGEFYRLPGVVLPGPGEMVHELVARLGVKHSLSSPLEVGHTYAVPLGRLRLPDNIYGYFNPKSSIGRIDVHCRVIKDRVSRYDTARPEKKNGGYEGVIWLLVTPNSFAIAPPCNLPLVQLRLFNADTRFNQAKLEAEWKKNPLAYRGDDPESPFSLDDFAMSDNDGTVLFTADLRGDENGIIGYRAKVTREILDLSRVYAHDPDDFFDPVRAKNGEVLLAPGVFYLLRTSEVVNVPPHLAAEIIAMDERIFEGRSHYAGFADPGFKDQITMEVRCHGMLLRQKQAIARVQYESLNVVPMADYRTRLGHYNKGNTFLSKHFLKKAA